MFRINTEIDREVDRFYSDKLGKYWDPERRLVETGYRTLSFPFREMKYPRFENESNLEFREHDWNALAAGQQLQILKSVKDMILFQR